MLTACLPVIFFITMRAGPGSVAAGPAAWSLYDAMRMAEAPGRSPPRTRTRAGFAMAAERGPDAASVPPERVRSRLMSFGAALQELREPDDGLPC